MSLLYGKPDPADSFTAVSGSSSVFSGVHCRGARPQSDGFGVFFLVWFLKFFFCLVVGFFLLVLVLVLVCFGFVLFGGFLVRLFCFVFCFGGFWGGVY